MIAVDNYEISFFFFACCLIHFIRKCYEQNLYASLCCPVIHTYKRFVCFTSHDGANVRG